MFKELNLGSLKTHVTIVGWLLIIMNALLLATGVFLFLLLTTVGVVSSEREAFAILGMVGTVLGGFLAVLALPGILAGIGLLRRRVWGRYLAIVISILNLLHFPIGTLIGVYALWVLLQETDTEYFAPQPAAAA